VKRETKMKLKTTELQRSALDWAVAKCEFNEPHYEPDDWLVYVTERDSDDDGWIFKPSTDWSQGGPIIEREWLDVTPWPNESDEDMRWQCKQHDSIDCVAFGPTPLVAAMRCYVASKLGDEVKVPKEILDEN
jgi:hypothetical protein